MATTILPKKAGQVNPMALDDDQYDALAADPTIPQFAQGSTYGTPAPATGTSAFGAPSSGGFSSSSSFASPATGFGSSSGVGASTNTFGGSTNMGSVSTSVVNQPVLTGAGTNAAQGADVLVENTNSDWINKKWRPFMGWMYMMVCVCDFTLFPILWSILQALSNGSVTSQWQPLTLQGAGLFHVAMGAVLGIAAYGRTKEKIEGKS
jgi:hypothetical protein